MWSTGEFAVGFSTGGLLREMVSSVRCSTLVPAALSSRPEAHVVWHRPTPGSQVRNRPVVLLHGLLQTPRSLDVVARSVSAAGFDCASVNYKTLGAGVSRAALALADVLPVVCDRFGADQVHVVAHSMGGLVTRAACTDPVVASQVATVITLGTPHAGTPLASRIGAALPAVASWVGDFMPGSAVLAELDAAGPASRVDWVSVYSPDDHLVPGQCGRFDHDGVTNIEVSGVGHAGLLYDPQVVSMVTALLLRADSNL